MGLHIHHAPHLLPLTESLAEVLATPLADPFAAELIGVPTAGVRDWLEQQFALRLGARDHHDGISANIQMVFPGRFTAAAFGIPLAASDAWEIDRLTWAVLQVLDTGAVSVPGWRPTSAVGDDEAGQPRARYATARRIADLFDGYANNRPQMIQQWAAGLDGDGTLDERGAVVPLDPDQRWQGELWRHLRRAVGVPSRAEELPKLLSDLAAGRLTPALPRRVALFGVSAVSAVQLAVLHALGSVREVHLFLVHPSNVAWANARHLGGRIELRSGFDATAKVAHPLLRSWARPAMEAASLVQPSGPEVIIHESPHPNAGGAPSLLRQIQADIIADREPAAVGTDARDRSVQIHACHGTTRQLEVLRDALCHLFAHDPSLAPHDIVVLCPDLDRFAPLVAAVLRRGSMPLPVRVSDLSLGNENPIAVALSAIVGVLADRCTVPEILALAALDPVRRKLGLSDDDIQRIDRWSSDLGTTWGLDSDHRGDWLTAHIDEGTWAATIDRLLVGAAMPAPSPRVGVGGIVPLDDMDAAGFATAGRLGELVARLRAAHGGVTGEHTIATWVRVLTDIVASLCAADPAQSWQLAQVMQTLDELRSQSCVAEHQSGVGLTLADIRSVLSGVLGGARGRLMVRTGSITVTAMVPVRNVPARVVCVLGLDEAGLRGPPADGDDLLGVRPCVGERDQRALGRHLLLDAIMAAGEHFIITCDGSDITTNRPLPLPVQLTELLDVVATTCDAAPDGGDHGGVGDHDDHGGDGDVDPPTVYRHSRQAYDERNFVIDASIRGPASFATDQPFSFDTAMLHAAQTRRQRRQGPDAPTLLSMLAPSTVSLDQLTDACCRPARTYVTGRLEARLLRQVEEIDTNIPLDVSPLEMSALGIDLLGHYRGHPSADLNQQWRLAKRLEGRLPPRSLADGVLDTVQREVDLILDATPELREQMKQTATLAIELTLDLTDDPAVHVRLVDTIERLAGCLVVRANFSRPRPRNVVRAALDLAALVLTDSHEPWEAIVVNRPETNTAKQATLSRLTPIVGPDREGAARRLLGVALDLHVRALREPLPLFERSSKELFETDGFDEDTFTRDLREDANKLLWESFAPDQVLALPQRTTDELAGIASLAPGARRAVALARYFWSSFHSFIAQESADGAAGDDG